MNCINRKNNSYYQIRGMVSNSSSPTETWLITYYDKDTNEIICKSFVKLWLSKMSYLPIKKPEEQGLEYEAEVYNEIKKHILNTNISKSFVEILDFRQNMTFDEVLSTLVAGMDENIKDTYRKYILSWKQYGDKVITNNDDPRYEIINVNDVVDILKENFIRNLAYMILRKRNRPGIYEIGENKTIERTMNIIKNIKNDLKFDYIETLSLENAITFDQLIRDPSTNDTVSLVKDK